jgi:hypothetical protein
MSNTGRRRYEKKPTSFVTAVQLDLDTDGLTYRKWGHVQRCKRGDWLVNNDGDVYTVDAKVFEQTYEKLDKGAYRKTTPVWAERATTAGDVPTKEGASHYEPGDYLVSNREDGSDAYCMSAAKFDAMYQPAD